MIFITGPMYSGKKEYISSALGIRPEDLASRAVWDVQDLAVGDPEQIADRLADYSIVIETEIGGGVVPVDSADRAHREAAGRLACLLAKRADTVIRVCCGLPQLLKGDWPCRSS